MEEELKKIVGHQIPIKTKSGNRLREFIFAVHPGVVVLTTNEDGSGRRTILAIDAIESFTADVHRDLLDGAD